MEITPSNITKYFDFINHKIMKFKNRQKKIWNLHLKCFHNTHPNIHSKSCKFQRSWYIYCMWELKFQPTVKDKLNIYCNKIKRRIQTYEIILSKICKVPISEDCIIYIVQHIV